jgi:hypothetical protein
LFVLFESVEKDVPLHTVQVVHFARAGGELKFINIKSLVLSVKNLCYNLPGNLLRTVPPRCWCVLVLHRRRLCFASSCIHGAEDIASDLHPCVTCFEVILSSHHPHPPSGTVVRVW